MPLERDEGEYAYFGQLMLQGVWPYAAAYSMKFPGIYAAFAAIEALFGQTAAAIRWGLLLVNLATGGCLFLLGRRLAGAEVGLAASAAFGVMSLSASVLGFAAHATHFVVLFAVCGLYVLQEAIASGRPWRFAASGVLLGLAYTMKQHGAVFAAFGALWLLVSRVPRGRLIAYLAGAAAPLAVAAAAIAAAGVFPRFWFWNFVYASQYVSQDTSLRNLGVQLQRMAPLAGFAILAVGGSFTRPRRPVAFAAGLAAFALIAVAPGFIFREHYFIQLLPAVALLAGLAIASAGRRLGRVAAAALLAAAAGLAVVSERAYLFVQSPVEVCRAIYDGNPFPEAVVVGDYIREHTRPSDRVLVLGSEPEIYFYARRRGATGYIYMYGLMEDQPYARRMQQELATETEAAKPEIVVLVGPSVSWLRSVRSVGDVFTWSRAFVGRSYERIGVVEIGDPPRAHWGGDAAGSQPQAESSLLVFRRRPGT